MTLLHLALPLLLTSLSTITSVQSSAHVATVAAKASPAEASFAAIKSLAGEWEGQVTIKEMPDSLSRIHVSLRVTSRGHAIVHELQEANTPLDAEKYDHPVTMMYLDDDQLTLVHYCDAGNRPRMR